MTDKKRKKVGVEITWLSKSPANLTSNTSKTHDFSRVTWSSWCRPLKPGMSFAKVQTWRTWSMKISEKWLRTEFSGLPFIGHACNNKKKEIKFTYFVQICIAKKRNCRSDWKTLKCITKFNKSTKQHPRIVLTLIKLYFKLGRFKNLYLGTL